MRQTLKWDKKIKLKKKYLTRNTVLELIEGEVNHEKGFFVDGQN